MLLLPHCTQELEVRIRVENWETTDGFLSEYASDSDICSCVEFHGGQQEQVIFIKQATDTRQQ
jgi:hypothetical protein